MKNITRVIALALALIMVFALVSCAKTISGTYVAEGGLGDLVGGKTTYTFKGSKVTVTVTTTVLGSSNSKSYEGTYEITEAEDGTMSISMSFEDGDASKYEVNNQVFEENKDAGTIKIGLVTYKKQ